MKLDLDPIVAAIYEAAVDQDRWQEALDKLCDGMGAVGAHFYYWNKIDKRADLSKISTNVSHEHEALYVDHYALTDPRRDIVDKLPVGRFMCCHEQLDEDFVRQSPLYQELLIPIGFGFTVAGCFEDTPEHAGYIGLHRARSDRPWLAHERQAMTPISFHLRKAFRIHRRISRIDWKQRSWREAIDGLPFGMLLLDAAGRAHDLNQAAEAIVRAADGLQSVGNSLTAEVTAEAGALADLIARAADPCLPQQRRRGGAMAISRGSGRAAYTVLVSPLPADQPLAVTGSKPLALAVVIDPDRRSTHLGRLLMAIYQLTPAEAIMVNALVSGRSLNDYAAEAKISKETARWRVKQVFSKTGTRRQHELTALVLKSFTSF